MGNQRFIKICTPYHTGISKATTQSVEALGGSGLSYEWHKAETTYIAQGRNALITDGQTSLKRPPIPGKWTHFLLLDSDISFLPEQLDQLLSHDRPIVGGAYTSRADPKCYVAGNWTLTEGNADRFFPVSTVGLKGVGFVGAGFLLVKRAVFEDVCSPWFCHEWLDYVETDGTQHSTQVGDDLSFCLRAQRAEYRVWADFDCVVNHITDRREAFGMGQQQQPEQGQQMSLEQILLSIHSHQTAVVNNVAMLEHTIREMAVRIAEHDSNVAAPDKKDSV